MPPALFLKPFISAPLHGYDSVPIKRASSVNIYVENGGRVGGIRMGMLAPRNFMQKRKKVEVFKDKADEAYQKNWRRLMNEIEEAGTAVAVLRRERVKNLALPRECTPDICSYTTMLSAYVNASDMDGAEKFFRRLKQDGLSPNLVTYGALIKGYAKANDLEKMMKKYEEMRSSGIRANQTVLTAIMDAYGKNKDFDGAVIWFKEMESSGVSPDKKARNILLSLAKSNEELLEANVLVGNMDWQDGVPETNAKVIFTHYKDADKDDDDDYEDDDADDKEEEDDDDDDSDDAEEAISIGVERNDAVALSSADMSYVH